MALQQKPGEQVKGLDRGRGRERFGSLQTVVAGRVPSRWGQVPEGSKSGGLGHPPPNNSLGVPGLPSSLANVIDSAHFPTHETKGGAGRGRKRQSESLGIFA